VEDVVGDLEGDPERESECSRSTGEPAGGLEQLAGLQPAALEVLLGRRVGVVSLRALQRLASGEAERRVGEDLDGTRVAGGCELGEATREQVVAGRTRRLGAVGRPGRGTTATDACA